MIKIAEKTFLAHFYKTFICWKQKKRGCAVVRSEKEAAEKPVPVGVRVMEGWALSDSLLPEKP